MTKFLTHIWKNFKTTIASLISAIVVFSLGRDYIAQDTAELITQVLLIIGASANVIMEKR